MPVESADYIHQFDQTSPKGTEAFSVAAPHIRLIKRAVRQTLPNLNSEMSASSGELNAVVGMTQTVLSAISELSATLSTNLLGVNQTATAAVQWGNSLKYTGTATPATVAANGIWFRPYT